MSKEDLSAFFGGYPTPEAQLEAALESKKIEADREHRQSVIGLAETTAISDATYAGRIRALVKELNTAVWEAERSGLKIELKVESGFRPSVSVNLSRWIY